MLVVELAGRKGYLRVNGVRNKVMSTMLSENRHQEPKSRGSRFTRVRMLALTLIYYVPVSSPITCLRLLTWKSR